MILSSIEIENFKSLRRVSLDGLGPMNILIGRNNSGKSSVFQCLYLLNKVIRGGSIPAWKNSLTNGDQNLSLRVCVGFDLREDERRALMLSLSGGVISVEDQDILAESAFGKHIRFEFVSRPGIPDSLRLRQGLVTAGDGKPATFCNCTDEADNSLTSFRLVLPSEDIRKTFLASNRFDLKQALESRNVHQGRVIDAKILRDVASSITELRSNYALDRLLYPIKLLERYLDQAFFFDSFRHGQRERPWQETQVLARDGSNLAEVLHSLISNNRETFDSIEAFIHSAIPHLGVLHSPLININTSVSFKLKPNGQLINLHDFGAGVEQLLMIATVIHTTSADHTLFIEEPENHLHPGAQRFLIDTLSKGNRAVFITTHSPVLLNNVRRATYFQVKYSNDFTTITVVTDPSSLGDALADIGAKNSDVLLSNAVIFVEGPSDKETVELLCRKLDVDLTAANITICPMGGGDITNHKIKIRGEVLGSISSKAPIPHLFLLDRDERSQTEIESVSEALGSRVHFLQRREIENYFLLPRAILHALRIKAYGNEGKEKLLSAVCEEDIRLKIANAATALYGHVLLRRVRADLGGMMGGIIPRSMADDLAGTAELSDLAEKTAKLVEDNLLRYVDNLNIPLRVASNKEQLDRVWADESMRLEVAPGEEILDHVFKEFGFRYRKSVDLGRIVESIAVDEIHHEIAGLLRRIPELLIQSCS